MINDKPQITRSNTTGTNVSGRAVATSSVNDGYTEYIAMNSDLQGKTREELYQMVIWLRAAIRCHRDYRPDKTTHDFELYRISLPENTKTATLGCEGPVFEP